MFALTDAEKRCLLVLARREIASRLKPGSAHGAPPEGIDSENLSQPCGCFVTLHKDGNLRGCIGSIEPTGPLASCVRQNAVNSAFSDPRFPPLSADELDRVDIEISVLTPPKVLVYTSADDLKAKLVPGVHGVILTRGAHRSTFLPQVWRQLPDTETFLAHLCTKAGLSAQCWKDPKLTVKTYTALYFSERS